MFGIRRFVVLYLMLVALGFSIVPSAHAQLGKALREGAEYLGKKALGEGAQEATEAGAKKLLREAATESSEQLLKKSGLVAARFSDDAAEALAKHGDAVVPLINQFGDDAAQAVSQVTGRNARRLAMLSDELAATPQSAEVLQLVTKSGKANQVVDFLWSHKGKLATTAIVATLIANTDQVLESGTAVSVSAIETMGETLVEPLAMEAAPTVRYTFTLTLLLLFATLLLGVTTTAIYVHRNYTSTRKLVARVGRELGAILGRK